MRLRELAQARPRFGYLRLHVMLRREGWVVNRKRVHRIYREEGLTRAAHASSKTGQSSAGRATAAKPDE